MRVFSAAVVIVVLSAIFQNFLPWWVIAPVSFLTCLLFRITKGEAFIAGFLALFLLWGGMAFFIDSGNEHILSGKIAALLKLPFSFLLILLTGLLGGLVAGLAGFSAGWLTAGRK